MKSSIKNTLKLAVLALLLALSASKSAQAQGQLVFTTNLPAGTTNTLIATNCYISEIDLISGAGTNDTLNFYDQYGNTNTYAFTNGYLTRTTVMTNIVQALTNGMGTLYTNTYPGEYTTTTSNAPATNALPVIASFAIVPSTKQAKAPLRLVCTRGLTVVIPADATNQTVVIYYSYPF